MRKPFLVCTMTMRASGRSRRDVFGPYVSSEWFDLVTVASKAVGLVCHTLSDEAVMVVNMLPARDVLMSTISCSSVVLSVVVAEILCSRGACSCSKTKGVSCPASGESGVMAGSSLSDGLMLQTTCLEAAYVLDAPMGQYMADYGCITLHLRKGTVVGIRPAATIANLAAASGMMYARPRGCDCVDSFRCWPCSSKVYMLTESSN
jgi:hypothetical protein